jgi:hypothetical protein
MARLTILLLLCFWGYSLKGLKVLEQFKVIKTVSQIKSISKSDFEEFPKKDTVEQPEVGQVLRNFVSLLEELKIRFPKVVLAQVLHETDYLNSRIYQDCNNLFGMKRSVYRHWDIGVCRGHAEYKTKIHSLYDYAQYQQEYLPQYERRVLKRPAVTDQDYYGFLRWAKYAEDRRYIEHLKTHMYALNKVI